MLLAPVKKLFSDVFSRHEVIYLCAEFEVSLTPATVFLPIDTTFFTNILWEYFSLNLLRVFHQPEVKFSKSGLNWANTSPLLLKTFESYNAMDSHIVHWLKVRKMWIFGILDDHLAYISLTQCNSMQAINIIFDHSTY